MLPPDVYKRQVQGGLLQGGGKLAGATGAAAQGLVLMDVTPLTLSIETLGGVATPLLSLIHICELCCSER